MSFEGGRTPPGSSGEPEQGERQAYRSPYGWGTPQPPPSAPPPGYQPAPPGGSSADIGPHRSFSDYPPHGGTTRRRGVLGALAALGLALAKYGTALKFVFPALLKAPLLLSILFNIGVYTLFFGPAFAVGFVALIFVHEMGHLIAARAEGVTATAPFFVPFMGAAIFLRDHPKDAKTEAIIGIGGPITGTMGALALLAGATTLGTENTTGLLFMRLAYYGFLINLFNMIPLSPLDGGRVLGAVSKWFNVAGMGLLLAGMFFGVLNSFILVLILVFGAMGIYRRWRQPEHMGYYDISPAAKAAIGISYLALLGVLVAGLVGTEPFIIGGL